MTFPEAVAAAEGLALEDQLLLRLLLSEAVYKKQTVHKKRPRERYDGLIGAGFVVEVDDPAGIVLDPCLEKVRKKLCTYLSRRNESENCVDENGVPYTIPKGAQFVASVSLGGSSLSLVFPDDEITALLDHYGVNRCKGWTP